MNLGASIASNATTTNAETNFILRDTIGYPEFTLPNSWIEPRSHAEGADAHIKSLRLGKPVSTKYTKHGPTSSLLQIY